MATALYDGLFVTASNSKPKIHRLPVSLTQAPPSRRFVMTRPAALGLAVGAIVVSIALLPLIHRSESVHSMPPIVAMQAIPEAAFGDASASTLSPDKLGKTIIIKGKNGSIVGQMAKIHPENEQVTEIKSVSDIDNHSGKELLSIISKY